jgi:hypothetical protein
MATKYYKLKDNVALCGGPRGSTIKDKEPRPETDFDDAEDLLKRGYIEEVEPSSNLLEAEDKALADEIAAEELAKKEAADKAEKEAEDKAKKDAEKANKK